MTEKNDFLRFFFISFLWSLTFPLVKHLRLIGINVWSISFYQCFFSMLIMCSQNNLRDFLHKTVLRDIKLLIILGIIRNFFGIVILNYLLLSQSITNVTIALLFIPFATLILDCLVDNFRPSNNQMKGILLSIISIMVLIYDFNHVNHIAWYYMPLTLLVSLLFGVEAILLSKTEHKPNIILFWQNLTGAFLLFCLILCLKHINTSYVVLALPIHIVCIALLVSTLSIMANNLFIRLTKSAGPSISTQINIAIVLFGCVYDKAIYGSMLMWHNLFLIFLMIMATKLILEKNQTSNRCIKHQT